MFRKLRFGNRKTFLTALICALLCCIVGLSVSFAATNGNKSAQASVTNSNTDIDFGVDGITSGDSTSMKQLFNVLTGKAVTNTTYSTYKDVYDKLATANINASSFASSATVTLAGQKFNIMYVSKATAATTDTNKGATNGAVGDVIVTLWMADVNTAYNSKWNPCYNANSNGDAIPTNMYSSSLIRSVLNGTPYVSNTSYTANTLPNARETVPSQWSPFSTSSGKFYNYLATPSQLSWQNTLNPANTANGYTTNSPAMPNENYAPASTDLKNFTSGFDYTSKGSGDYAYGAWQYDKLWLPALSETGYSDTATNQKGLWQTNATQRGNTASTYAWLRSGDPSGANYAYLLNYSGGRYNSNVNRASAVRPALHLNLKSAAKAAGLPAGEDQALSFTTPTFATSTGFTLSTDKLTATVAWSSSPRTLNLSSATNLVYTLPTNWTQSTTTPTQITIPANAAVNTTGYTIKVVPASGYKWQGTTEGSAASHAEKTLKVIINNNQIDVPSITAGSTVYYSATAARTATVSSTTGLTYTMPSGKNWTMSGSTITIPAATAVDKYTIKVKPSTGYVWKSDSSTTEKELYVTVTNTEVAIPTFKSASSDTTVLSTDKETATAIFSTSEHTLTLSATTGLTYSLPTGSPLHLNGATVTIPASTAVNTNGYIINVTPQTGYKWTGTTDKTTAASQTYQLTVIINSSDVDAPAWVANGSVYTLSDSNKTATMYYSSSNTARVLKLNNANGITVGLPNGKSWSNNDGSVDISVPRTDVGTYTVTINLKSGYKWKNETSTAAKTLTVVITNTQIDTPYFSSASSTDTSIDSTNKQKATTIFSTDLHTITLSSDTGLTYSLPTGSPLQLSGKTLTIPAGTAVNTNGYIVNVAPVTGYKWTGTTDLTAASNEARQLTVIINPREVDAPVWVANGSVYTLSDGNKTATMYYSSSNTPRILKLNNAIGITVGLPNGVSWTNSDGSADISVPVTAVNTYTVTISLKTNYKWKNEASNASKSLTVVITNTQIDTPYFSAASSVDTKIDAANQQKATTIYSTDLHTITFSSDTGLTYSLPTDSPLQLSGKTLTIPAGTAVNTNGYVIYVAPQTGYKWTGTADLTAAASEARQLTVIINPREIDAPVWVLNGSVYTLSADSKTATMVYSPSNTSRTLKINLTAGITVTTPDGKGWTYSDGADYISVPKTDADSYTVTIALKDNYKWKNEVSAAAKTLTVVISKATPTTDPHMDAGTIYFIGRKLTSDYSGKLLRGSSDTPGTYTWTADSTIDSETFTANWTFTSSDSNYANTTGTITINAVRELSTITATALTTYIAFQSFDMSSLEVTANFKGGVSSTTITPDSVTLPYEADGRTSFGVKDNNTNVVITYTEHGITKSCYVKVTVTPATVTGIDFDDAPTPFDGTKKTLSVTGTIPAGISVQYYYAGTQNIFSGEVNAGDYDIDARFTASASSDYAAPAEMTARLTITTKTVRDENVSGIDDFYGYTGELREITPVVTVDLASGATTLKKDVDYEITYDNTTNFEVGAKVTVTLTFKGNYDGSYTKEYQIIRATVGYEIDIDENGYTYNGGQQGPTATLTHVAEVDKDIVTATLKYKGINGTDYAETDEMPVNAGWYSLTISLDGSYTNYITFQPYTVEFEIKKATPAVEYSLDLPDHGRLYVGSKLPDITLTSATLNGNTVEGTLEWISDNVLLVNTNTYTWKFTPDDTENFEEVTGTEDFSAEIPTIVAIAVHWKNDAQPTVYTSTELDDLRPYIVVIATLVNNDEIEVTDYALSGTWGGEITPPSAGAKQLEIMCDGQFDYLDIIYTDVLPERIDIDQSSAKTQYDADEVFDKTTITVKVIYNDGSDKTLDADDFDIIYNDGNALCFGDRKVEVSYTEKGVTVTGQVAITKVNRLTYNMDGITFSWADKTYDEKPHSATFTGTFTIGTVDIKYYEKQSDGTYTELVGVTEVTDAGDYKVVATFTITSARDKKNYYAVSAKEIEITVAKATYDVAGMKFDNSSAYYDYGNAIPHGMAVENVPNGVTVTYVWTDSKGNTVDPANITTAGTYNVVASFTVDDNHNAILDMKATFTVNKIDPTIAEPNLNGLVQAGTILRDLTFVGLPTDTDGKFTWDNPDYVLVVGSNTLNYTFTPDDTVNYNVKHLQMTKNVVLKTLMAIGVTVTQHDVDLYSSYDLDKFKTYLTTNELETDKILLKITAVYNDQTQETVYDDYEVYLLNGDLTLKDGYYKFGVKYEGKTYESATVKVIKVALESITADFEQNGKDIYSSGSVADILALLADGTSGVTLTVTGTNNDGEPNTDTLTYTLTADDDWTAMTGSGNVSVTVTIDGTNVKTKIQVYVTLKQLTEIEVAFNQNNKPVYASNELSTVENLLADATSGVTLTVTAKYNDGDEQDVALSDLTLIKTGKFGEGNQVTVSFTDGVTVTATFDVDVTAVQVTYITVVRDNPLSKIYTDTSFDDLRDMITVTAHFNDGTQAETADYDFSLADGGTKLTAGEIVITLTYTGDDIAINCQPLHRPVTVFKHDTIIDISGVLREYTYTGDEQTVTGAEITAGDDGAVLVYSDNATFTDVPTGGRIVVTVSVDEGENYLAASREIQITVYKAALTVTAKETTISFGDAPTNDGVEITGFVGTDGETVLNGELKYSYNYALYGAAGDYVITVSGLSADNYEISYETGKLIVNKKTVTVAWTGIDVVYNGEMHTPHATFEDIYGSNIAMTVTIMDESGNHIVTPVKSGTYTVTATSNNPNYEFEDAETAFVIKAAEIRVKSSSDQWFDEQGLYTGHMVLITLDALDDENNYKFISVSGLQDGEVQIMYSQAYPLSDDSITVPTPGEETDYRKSKPGNIITAGRYVVNYRISAPNHDDYFGQWKIEIVDIEDPEAHYVIVMFEKAIDLTYGNVPQTEEELAALAQKLVDENYVKVSGGLTAEQFLKVTKLKLSVDNRNTMDSTTEVGDYTPYFVFTDEYKSVYEDYTIFYKQSNDAENSNVGKIQLNCRVLSVTWSASNFEYDGTAKMPKATVTDKLTGATAEIEMIAGVTNYQVTLGETKLELNVRIEGNVIEMGGYSISVSIDNANYEVENPFKTVSITPVGGNPTTPSNSGRSNDFSYFKWLVPVAAGVIALAVILAAVVMRRRPSVTVMDDDGFNDDYEGDEFSEGFADVYTDY